MKEQSPIFVILGLDPRMTEIGSRCQNPTPLVIGVAAPVSLMVSFPSLSNGEPRTMLLQTSDAKKMR